MIMPNIKMILQVKADVHSVSGELIVSGLDSATSLIQVSCGGVRDADLTYPNPEPQAARNLMEAVVLTVKASYVASRMFNNHKQVTLYLNIVINMSIDHCCTHQRTYRQRVPIRHVHLHQWSSGRCGHPRSSHWCEESHQRRWDLKGVLRNICFANM